MSVNYNDSSIDALIGEKRIRTRPASVLGSDGLAGARHGVIEITGNAVDEGSKKILMIYHEDGSITVRDYGSGVPMGWNDKPYIRNWNWHVIYNDLYGGGKYENHQEQLGSITDWSKFKAEDFLYLFSIGLNGLGAASTQYTSEFFEVRSYRDGECKSRNFRKGRPVVGDSTVNMFSMTQEDIEAIPEEISVTDEENGTSVHWKPDLEVFSDIDIGSEWLYQLCRSISNIARAEVEFIDEKLGKHEVFESGSPMKMLLENCGNKVILDSKGEPCVFLAEKFTHGNTIVNNKDFIYVCKCEVAFGLVKHDVESVCHHNSTRMLSGIQYDGIRTATTEFFSARGRENGVKLEYSDYSNLITAVVSTYSNTASLRGQTKDGVDDYFIYEAIKDTVYEKLVMEYGRGNSLITEAVERAIEAARIRMETREAIKMIKEARSVKKEAISNKFVSCIKYEEKNYEGCEMYICEGDSAGDAVVRARYRDFQAVYKIRGRGLNVLKASIKKSLSNKEVREIINVIGTGFDLNLPDEKSFDISKLRFDKVIIDTDADIDGAQIRVLVFLIFYVFAPEVIRQGKLYVVETPLFLISLNDGSSIYAWDDADRDRCIEEYGTKISHIQRFKGLGELNSDTLKDASMNPDKRRLIQMTCDFENQSEVEWVDALFGKDKFHQRKEIIKSVMGYDSDLFTKDEIVDFIDSIGEDGEDEIE